MHRKSIVINLGAARDGSIDALMEISESVKTLPSALLPDALDVFLIHLDAPKMLTLEEQANDGPVPLHIQRTYRALRGLEHVAASFLSDECLRRRVLDRWSGVAKAIRLLYDYPLLEETFGHFFGDIVIDIVMDILQAVGTVPEDLGKIWNESICVLISKIWLKKAANLVTIDNCATILLRYKHKANMLFDLLSRDGTLQKFVNISLRLLYKALRNMHKGESSDFSKVLLHTHVLLFTVQTEHPISRLAPASGGISLIIKSMRYLIEGAANHILIQERKGLATGVTVGSLAFLKVTIEVDVSLLRKAVRMGLFHIICALAPWLPHIDDPMLITVLRDILQDTIPGAMIYKRTVCTMRKALNALSEEEHEAISTSILGEEWTDMYETFKERQYCISHKFKHCHTVSTPSFSILFKILNWIVASAASPASLKRPSNALGVALMSTARNPVRRRTGRCTDICVYSTLVSSSCYLFWRFSTDSE